MSESACVGAWARDVWHKGAAHAPSNAAGHAEARRVEDVVVGRGRRGGQALVEHRARGAPLERVEQSGRDNVEEDLRVGSGVDVAPLLAQALLEVVGVDEVAVVRERDAERVVHVEGLRLRRARRAGGRVAHMADANVAGELGYLLLLEDVADLAVVLVQAQPPVVLCDDAGRILAAVLQGEERLVDGGDRGRALGADDAGDAAHGGAGGIKSSGLRFFSHPLEADAGSTRSCRACGLAHARRVVSARSPRAKARREVTQVQVASMTISEV